MPSLYFAVLVALAAFCQFSSDAALSLGRTAATIFLKPWWFTVSTSPIKSRVSKVQARFKGSIAFCSLKLLAANLDQLTTLVATQSSQIATLASQNAQLKSDLMAVNKTGVIGAPFEVVLIGFSPQLLRSRLAKPQALCAPSTQPPSRFPLHPETTFWTSFNSKVFDTHNAVSGAGTGSRLTSTGGGWTFTVPVTGTYRIESSLRSFAATFAAGAQWDLKVYVGGSMSRSLTDFFSQDSSVTQIMHSRGSCLLSLTSGQLIQMVLYVTGLYPTVSTVSENNYVYIESLS
jgi:hypothetical protein